MWRARVTCMMCIAVVFSAAPAGSFREMVDRRRGIFRLRTKRSKTEQKEANNKKKQHVMEFVTSLI